MNRNDLSLFCCLGCGSDLHLKDFKTKKGDAGIIEEGMLYCDQCRNMYPVIGRIPFLIDRGYYKDIDMQEFFEAWKGQFEFSQYKLLQNSAHDNKIKQSDFYNIDAEVYDNLVTDSNFWRVNDWNTIHRWISELPDDGVTFDMGCGTGRCTIPIAKSGKRVLGMDISIGMLRKAIAKSEESGVGNITYFLSDGENMPVKTGVFSAAISFGLLHHVDNPDKVIEGVERVLKRQGIFYAAENNSSPLRPIFDFLMKLKKLWNEEAGSHPLLKINEVKKILVENGMHPEIRTSTFLPPHIFNLMGYEFAKKVLYGTDCFFGYIPGVRNAGGLLIIKAIKA